MIRICACCGNYQNILLERMLQYFDGDEAKPSYYCY